MNTPNLDALLSPENFPPCDPLRGDAVRELDTLKATSAALRSDLDNATAVQNSQLAAIDQLQRRCDALLKENAAMLQAGGYEHMRSQVVELERKADALRGNAELIAAERHRLREENERLRADMEQRLAEHGRYTVKVALREHDMRQENSALAAKAAMADERAVYITNRIGGPGGDFDSMEERDWYRRYSALSSTTGARGKGRKRNV